MWVVRSALDLLFRPTRTVCFARLAAALGYARLRCTQSHIPYLNQFKIEEQSQGGGGCGGLRVSTMRSRPVPCMESVYR